MKTNRSITFKRRLFYVAVASCFTITPALGNPLGATVVNGQVGFAAQGTTLTVTNTPNAIINWQQFSIGSGETTRFVQQSASSAVLNRVIGQDPSQLLGSLLSNGRVYLINPNGILFGQGAVIDVAGLVASTLKLSDGDFLAGKLNFTSPLPAGDGAGVRAGGINNQGSITTPAGGNVYLIAPDISNSGIISSPQGEILLAAGHIVNLMDTANPNVQVTVGAPDTAAVNLGTLMAQSGRVGIYGTLINHSGTINADAAVVGDGGKITLKATGSTLVSGTLSARGGQEGGNGGFIETSGAHVSIADSAKIDTSAPKGKTGNWLIDPVDFTIAATGGDITGAALDTLLGSNSVTIQTTTGSNSATNLYGSTGTNGDIFVNDTVSWNANTLTLNAIRNISINATLNGSGTAGLALQYGQGAIAAGNTATYSINAPVNLASTGSFSTKLGSDGVTNAYTIITSLGAAGSTTGTDLQGMSGNISGRYVLGADIDATATSGWNSGAGFLPVGVATSNLDVFTGRFDGLGHTITNLFIYRPSASNVGLFGGTDSADIRNVGLVGGTMTGTVVGGLVGSNGLSTIANSYNTGTVSGNYYVGGLVGFHDQGAISNSYSTGAVSGSGVANYVGGLVGYSRGAISNSYSTGAVSSPCFSCAVGGLVGNNGFNNFSGTIINGTITNSYSAGAVSAASAPSSGGLVGYNVAGTITNSYWDTQTSGKATSAGGTGLTTANAMTQSSYTGWDFTNTWWMAADGNTRPFLRMEYSTNITNAHQLQLMAMNLGASYTLANNIDMAELTRASGMWNVATGFVPVGNSSTNFTGIFDGLGHTITNLYINRPATDYIGLFGYTNGATISNVGLVGGTVSGYIVGGLAGANGGTITDSYSTSAVSGTTDVGGLVGLNLNGAISNSYSTGAVSGSNDVGGLVGNNYGYYGTISNSYSTGAVSGTASYVGGLVGNSYLGPITDSYSTGAVNGTASYVGGLVGYVSTSTITNSYSTGAVSGIGSVGGLVGYNAGTIISSYWDMQTSNQATSTGGTGLTTAQMMQSSNFSGWDFTNTWGIQNGVTYPYLKTIAANLPAGSPWVISGTAAAGSVDVIGNGILLGTATVTGGSFTLSLPSGTVTNGEALVVAGAGTSGTLLFATSNNLSLGLLTNTLLTNAVSSLSDFVTAKGSLADTNIPYTVSGANVATNTGVGFVSNAGFTLNGNLQASGITMNGLVTLSGSHTLDSRSGNLVLAGGANGAANNLTLNSTGSVTQGAAINVAGLELLGAGGNYQLTNTGNTVGTLAGNTGSVNFTNSGSFSVGTVNSTAGITSTGDVTLLAGGGGDLTISNNILKDGAMAATVNLQADNNIIFNTAAGIGLTPGTGSNTITAVLNSDRDASGAGNIQMLAGSSITTNGGNITMGGGANPLTTPAVGTATSIDPSGIYLSGATLNAGAGNISMRGTGLAGTALANGVYVTDYSVIQTTSGNITVNGTGGAGTTENSGVRLGMYAQVSSATGAMNIIGKGGDGTGLNYGIYIHDGATVSSTTNAPINLDGTGGAGGTDNYGVLLSSTIGSTAITSVNGGISLTGRGGAGTSYNYGLYIHNGAVVSSAGTGTITLDGTGGAGTNGNNYGVRVSNSGNLGTMITSATGAISITGHGAGTGSSNYGVGIVSGAVISSTDGGAITLDGTGAGTDAGIYASNASISSTSGSATIDFLGHNGITVDGGSVSAAAGNGGNAAITLDGGSGEILLDNGASVQVTGGMCCNNGGSATVTLTTLGNIISQNSASVGATGGEGGADGSGNGGDATVTLTTVGVGGITIQTGSSFTATGGYSGSSNRHGGAATVTLDGGSGSILLDSATVAAHGSNAHDTGGDALVTLMTAATGGITIQNGSVVEAISDPNGYLSSSGGNATVELTSGSGGILLDNASIHATGGTGDGNCCDYGIGGNAAVTLTTSGGINLQNGSVIDALAGDSTSCCGGYGGAASVTFNGATGITLNHGGVTATGGAGSNDNGGDATVTFNDATGITLNQGYVTAYGGYGNGSNGNGGAATIALNGGNGVTISGSVEGSNVYAHGGYSNGSGTGGAATIALNGGSGGILLDNGASVYASGGYSNGSGTGGAATIALNGGSGGILLDNWASVYAYGGYSYSGSAGSATTTLTTSSNVVLNNGSSVYAGSVLLADIGGNFTIDNNSSAGGGVDVGSAANPVRIGGKLYLNNYGILYSGSLDSIFLYFPNLTSGGYVVNGTEGMIADGSSPYSGTGMYVSNSIAILDVNLHITYASTINSAVLDALNFGAGTTNGSTIFGGVIETIHFGNGEEDKKNDKPVCT